MIRIENLTKFYGDFRAVDNVSFTINDGEILGFLGPNGAGKTTTLKILTCFMPPSEGSITFNDMNVREHSMEIRKMIGYLPENAPLYEYMSIREYLDYICDLRDIHGQRRKDRMDAMIELCGLSRMMGKDIGELSKGYRQRVGIAQAMIHEPQVLILDEPTAGLDPKGVQNFKEIINSLSSKYGLTVIFSTHDVSLVPEIADYVYVMNKGRIIAQGSVEEIFIQPEMLESARLEMPVLPRLITALRSQGIQMSMAYTYTDAEKEFLKAFGLKP